ncbi:sigma-70 family RNA polymerase sigma factor [Bacillus sp. RAR_GA_16]|uniref:sigma-70 family RNA polymerase sigma factor n=1 Tax=Bacillus sp. RAR_GA_16 TaxID=2876774 RepID=UPI001CCF16EF|nr:sigma-70 family RNA polymerase sigma factor [Bacillus sp. RAR_GA_16]MCA0170607.1 sigma-70 family RNA polymerase sigma factor [Bacillus sp. RAR_GA_16]
MLKQPVVEWKTEEGFREVINRYSNALYAVSYSVLGDYHLAQDVAQEAFIKAYLKRHTLEAPGKLGSWLTSIARNLSLDLKRKRKRMVQVMERSFQEKALQLLETKETETSDLVWLALYELKVDIRTSVVLHYMGGYSMQEIASMLTCSTSAVESRIRRARATLKKEMSELVEKNLKDQSVGEEFERKVFKELRLRSALFDQVELTNANFMNSNLAQSIFTDAYMVEATFKNMNMSGISFRDIDLSDLKIEDAQMGGAVFRNIGLPPEDHHAAGRREQHMPLLFEKCDLHGSTLTDCNLKGVKIEKSEVEGMTIDGISVEELLKVYKEKKSE